MSDMKWLRFIRKLKPYNIQKGLRYLKHYGPKEFLIRLSERMEPEEVPYGPWREQLRGADGKPLRTAVEISFPGQSDAALRATVSEVTIDAEQDIARFVLQCNSINGDVLCLNHARARISTGESTGLRVPAAAVHYLKEDGTEAETQGENYIPGVYVKYGNIARFCKIDPVDADHPLISEDDYILVLPKGTDGSVSQVRLYDEIIVSGQNLYDGKLL